MHLWSYLQQIESVDIPNFFPGGTAACATHRLRCRGQSFPTHRLTCRGQSFPTHRLRCRGQSFPTHRLTCRGQSFPTRTTWYKPMPVQYATFFSSCLYCSTFRCNGKVQTRCCSFFLSFLKAIVCLWADDFIFLGRLPAVSVTAGAPAPDPRAAGGCRRGCTFFTTGFSLKKISIAAVVFEIRQL